MFISLDWGSPVASSMILAPGLCVSGACRIDVSRPMDGARRLRGDWLGQRCVSADDLSDRQDFLAPSGQRRKGFGADDDGGSFGTAPGQVVVAGLILVSPGDHGEGWPGVAVEHERVVFYWVQPEYLFQERCRFQ